MQAEDLLRTYRTDPIRFVRQELRAEPDPFQEEVLRIFPKTNRIAVKSNKGPGKTALLAWLILNFLLTRPHPKIACTSITGDNLADNLWPELAKWMARSPLLTEMFAWGKTRIVSKEKPENWFASARNWPRSGDAQSQADALAGLHADYLLFCLDEVGGIPDAVMAAAEAALATGIETKILMCGNPTNLDGPLYRACTSEKHLWYVVEVTGDPDDPKRSPRISVQWAREQIDKYGRDNPWVMVNVFGRFPPASLNQLLGPEDVNAAMRRDADPQSVERAQKRLGIDVARYGDDRTVIFPRQGLQGFLPVEMRNASGPEIAARVALARSRWGSQGEYVDDTGGYGAGVVDSMIQAGLSPIGINFAGKADEPRYMNRRAEMYFRMAEWVKRGGCLPKMPELVRELCAPTYTFVNGKFKLEEKQQIKERVGMSPDYADALALTFATAEAEGGVVVAGEFIREGAFDALADKSAGKLLWDYDPLAD
jgi:hypothetical protein